MPHSTASPEGRPEGSSRVHLEVENSRASPTPSSTPMGSVPSGAVAVGCGFLLVDNDAHPPFSVLLKGRDVRQAPTAGELVFVLDGVLVEVTTTTAEEVGVPGSRGTALLEAHKEWELDHLRRTKEWPGLKAAGGGPLDIGAAQAEALMWGVDFPAEVEVMGQMANRLAFVTAAIDDSVLVLGIPLRAADDPRIPAMKAGSILRTLERLPGPLDVHALAADLQKSQKPWKGCARND